MNLDKPADSKNNYRLIFGRGEMQTTQKLRDELFGVEFQSAISYERKVEVYSKGIDTKKIARNCGQAPHELKR